jgi:hypothetical protein
MRRLARHLLICVAIFLLGLCAATLWLWVRSHRGPDYVEYGGNGKWLMKVISGHGTMDFLVIPRWPQEEEFRVGRYPDYVYYGTRYSKRVLGFGTDEQWPEYGGRYVNVPHWFIAVISGGLSALLSRRWWKRRFLAMAGRCGRCGYDLRATPDRCPECGAAAA